MFKCIKCNKEFKYELKLDIEQYKLKIKELNNKIKILEYDNKGLISLLNILV